MLCCHIPVGYLFYDEIHRRQKVEITQDLREFVLHTLAEMHKEYSRRATPKVKVTKKCRSCSLKDLCLPKLEKAVDVSDYYAAALKGV